MKTSLCSLVVRLLCPSTRVESTPCLPWRCPILRSDRDHFRLEPAKEFSESISPWTRTNGSTSSNQRQSSRSRVLDRFLRGQSPSSTPMHGIAPMTVSVVFKSDDATWEHGFKHQ